MAARTDIKWDNEKRKYSELQEDKKLWRTMISPARKEHKKRKKEKKERYFNVIKLFEWVEFIKYILSLFLRFSFLSIFICLSHIDVTSRVA